MAKTTSEKKSPSALEVIDAKINSIRTRGVSLRNDCHSTLILIVNHAIEHGDHTRLIMLHSAIKDALGSSLSAAMILWVNSYTTFLKFDPEKVQANNTTKGDFVQIKGEKKAIRVLEKAVNSKTKKDPNNPSKALVYPVGISAADMPFWEVERDVPQTPVDFGKQFHDLVIRARDTLKAMNEPNFKGKKIINLDAEKLQRIADLAVSLGYVKPDEFKINSVAAMGPDGANLADEAEKVQQLKGDEVDTPAAQAA